MSQVNRPIDLTQVPAVPWAWVDEHVYAAIRGCSVKVLQNERRLNTGCPFRRINGTAIRYKMGDITEFLEDYRAKHRSASYAEYAFGHVTEHLGDRLVVEITPKVVKSYQTSRLREKAGPKTINDEVMLLIRLCGDQGELIRATLRREK